MVDPDLTDADGNREGNTIFVGMLDVHCLVFSEGRQEDLQNYPNPFNSSTTIKARVSEGAREAFVEILDYFGNELMRFKLNNGLNSFAIKSRNLPSGIYIYSLIEDGNRVITNKMVVME